VSGEASRRIAVEFALLDRLLDDHAELVTQVAGRAPQAWERSALAALLHAYYNGVENAFKILAAKRAGVPSSADWHAALLASMTAASGLLPAVIDSDLGTALDEYMRFRHFFRHSYVFDLDWEKMRPLIEALAPVDARFREQVRAYLASVPEA
jgi:hypothetical protein